MSSITPTVLNPPAFTGATTAIAPPKERIQDVFQSLKGIKFAVEVTKEEGATLHIYCRPDGEKDADMSYFHICVAQHTGTDDVAVYFNTASKGLYSKILTEAADSATAHFLFTVNPEDGRLVFQTYHYKDEGGNLGKATSLFGVTPDSPVSGQNLLEIKQFLEQFISTEQCKQIISTIREFIRKRNLDVAASKTEAAMKGAQEEKAKMIPATRGMRPLSTLDTEGIILVPDYDATEMPPALYIRAKPKGERHSYFFQIAVTENGSTPSVYVNLPGDGIWAHRFGMECSTSVSARVHVDFDVNNDGRVVFTNAITPEELKRSDIVTPENINAIKAFVTNLVQTAEVDAIIDKIRQNIARKTALRLPKDEPAPQG